MLWEIFTLIFAISFFLFMGAIGVLVGLLLSEKLGFLP